MKLFFKAILFAAVTVLCCGCSGNGTGRQENGTGAESDVKSRTAGGPWQHVDTAMGTVVQMTVYTSDQETAERFFEQAMETLTRLEQEEISWRLEASEVYRANESAGSEEGFLLSEDLAGLLEACVELWTRSEGALDVTLGTVTRLWDIDSWAADGETEGFQVPSQDDLAQVLNLCGTDRLRLVAEDGGDGADDASPDNGMRLFLPEGMRLDLGAVGKGLAMEKLYDLLEESDVTGAVISLGGGIMTYGAKLDGSAWRVGVVDPFDTSGNIGILSLEGQWCISTSGDYERYVEVDGVRYHHILDPKTGTPADSGVRGVTILTKDGLLSDGLSTAGFILGPEKGMELAGQYGAEALFVMEDGSIQVSEGIGRYFDKME